MVVKSQLTLDNFDLDSIPNFEDRIRMDLGSNHLKALALNTFQMNIGRWCNQACKHCHVDASPIRTEFMDLETIDICLNTIKNTPSIELVDLTGGAPEGNPHFSYIVEECRKLGKRVIDRCNLTILEEDGYEHLYEFLAEEKVEIVSSLPHFNSSRTNQQRGDGVFEKSITALQKLNQLGYGNNLKLDLVYNPTGLFLSASQKQLEKEYKTSLFKNHKIIFNNLICINNMPINRFLKSLERNGKLQDYMDILLQAYNPLTLDGLMCRQLISVGYDGSVYDCDFNQMLNMKVKPITHIKDFNYEMIKNRNIQLGNHCYGCTAGAGSSCGGEIAK